MRRKPSASHWVHQVPEERKSPISLVLAVGSISVTISSVNGPSGTSAMVSLSGVAV